MRRLILAAVFAFCASGALGQSCWWCSQCGQYHCGPRPSAPTQHAIDPSTETTEEQDADAVSQRAVGVTRARFTAQNEKIADEVDQILDRLTARYGAPKVWKSFPVIFRPYTGNGVAGYTLYSNSVVKEVVVYESLENAIGGTLDHELTHAFFFYFLNSNFDLFLNEGVAQNSEYRRREALRQTVYRRYSSGEFWPIDKLYGRDSYDNSLLIYHEGFSVVDFLIGRGGSEWFAAFLRDLLQTGNINDSLARFYDYKTLSELQVEWHKYINNGQDRKSVEACN